MDRIPVFQVKEVDAVAEYAGLVIALDAEPLSRVQPAEAPLQLRRNVLLQILLHRRS